MEAKVFSRSIRVGATLILSFLSWAASSAAIQPGGGWARVSPSIPPPVIKRWGPQYGNFEAYNQIPITDVFPGESAPRTVMTRTASVSGYVLPDELGLHAEARFVGSEYSGLRVGGLVTGGYDFSIAEAGIFRFSFQQSQLPSWNEPSNIRFTMDGPETYLRCEGRFFDIPAHCNAPSAQWPSPSDGFISLVAGYYHIGFEAYAGGMPLNSDFDFKLTAVPLPAALPLLLSGLGVLGLRRRRVQA